LGKNPEIPEKIFRNFVGPSFSQKNSGPDLHRFLVRRFLKKNIPELFTGFFVYRFF